MIFFIFGLFAGVFFFEPIIINFIYMSNPGLFLDIILTKKNRKKLFQLYKELEEFIDADGEIWGDDFD